MPVPVPPFLLLAASLTSGFGNLVSTQHLVFYIFTVSGRTAELDGMQSFLIVAFAS